MARNVIDGSHFVKNLKKIRVAYRSKWPEMCSKVNFGLPKWAPAVCFVKKCFEKKFRIDLKYPEMPSKVN